MIECRRFTPGCSSLRALLCELFFFCQVFPGTQALRSGEGSRAQDERADPKLHLFPDGDHKFADHVQMPLRFAKMALDKLIDA